MFVSVVKRWKQGGYSYITHLFDTYIHTSCISDFLWLAANNNSSQLAIGKEVRNSKSVNLICRLKTWLICEVFLIVTHGLSHRKWFRLQIILKWRTPRPQNLQIWKKMPKILQELKQFETTDVSNMYLNNWMTEHFSKLGYKRWSFWNPRK